LTDELQATTSRLEEIAALLADESASAEHATLAEEAVTLSTRVSELVARFLREAAA
jgi:hypothetical protein